MASEAVVAESLAKLYEGRVWGARSVSFTASYSSVTVLLGPNGAGKTTTVRMLATLIRPTRGRAIVAGFDVVREVWEVRKRIALVPQEARVDPNLTPFESVKWYLVARGWSIGDAEKRAREILEALGLWEVRDRLGWHLSGGQRRKVVTAMVLASEADVVFLDEPTTGLDVESRYAMWSVVRRAARDGRCVLLTTHDMREAEVLADKAVFIHEGVVVAEGSPRELRERLPWRYRVVARGVRSGVECNLRIEDACIVYAAGRREAHSIAESIDAESVAVEEVSFEDVYLYHVKRVAAR